MASAADPEGYDPTQLARLDIGSTSHTASSTNGVGDVKPSHAR